MEEGKLKGDGASGEKGKIIDPSSSLYLSPSDNLGALLVTCKLTGNNYSTWSRAMTLNAKNKVGFLDGTITQPEVTSENYGAWRACNAMVIGWVFNLLDLSLQASVAYAQSAWVVWEDLRQRFLQRNATRVQQIKAKLSNLRQEGQTVPKYYTELKVLWDELDDYSVVQRCTCAAATEYAKEKEVEKIHQFLMGLNS
ncbi:hypothetical protein CRG98_010318 [Punica granatum]|uniref:Retrotransposon Copia-like N-terminal domain-containing protein n=1 Tax=Punica granatum TaxID=22663 RepID=A0A2I0KLD5_PUNGR|nr:hypothetical protein CRG98_010318 [Punica granatum]